MTDSKLKHTSRSPVKYPYTAFMLDNAGNHVLFWITDRNRGHIMNTTPIVTVQIDEERLTAAPVKSVLRPVGS